MTRFRTYQLAKELYLEVKILPLKGELKDQVHRAALSICLNLSEGNARLTSKDRKRFFNMAFASLREVQTILELEQLEALIPRADHLAACLWKLVHSL